MRPTTKSPFAPLVLALSGISGCLAVIYQVLYISVVQLLLGATVNIMVVTMAVFIGAVALGALVSRRLVRWLWLTELILGLFTLLFGAIFKSDPGAIIGIVSALPLTQSIRTLAAIILMAPPAVLVGISIPAFTVWLHCLYSGKATTHFNLIYFFYHLVAGAAALVATYIALPTIGLSTTLAISGVINVGVGLALWVIRLTSLSRIRMQAQPIGRAFMQYRSLVWPLFAAGTLSAMIQCEFLVWTNALVMPLSQNFAAVVALSMFGMALGTVVLPLVERLPAIRHYPFSWFCVACALFFSIAAYAVLPLAQHIGHMRSWFGVGPTSALVPILMLGILPYIAIGGLVPAFYRRHALSASVSSVSVTMAAAGLGNVTGFIGFIAFITNGGSDLAVIVIAAVCFTVLALLDVFQLETLKRQPIRWVIIGSGVAVLLTIGAITQYHLPASLEVVYQRVAAPTAHDDADDALDPTEGHPRAYFATTQSFNWGIIRDSIVWDIYDRWRLVLSGYAAINGPKNQAKSSEVVVGALPAFFQTQHQRALVVGVGTGTTTTATAAYYDQVDALDIDPNSPAIIRYLSNENDALATKKNVTIKRSEALSYLWHNNTSYNAIVLTPTPVSYLGSYVLSTREFYQQAKAHLSPDGILISWFDSSTNIDGIKSILHTLHQTFGQVRLFPIGIGYYVVIASDASLAQPHQTAMAHPSPVVREALLRFQLQSKMVRAAHPHTLSIRHAVASITFPAPDYPDAHINTLDQPLLQFQTVSGYSATGYPAFSQSLVDSMGFLNHLLSVHLGIDLATPTVDAHGHLKWPDEHNSPSGSRKLKQSAQQLLDNASNPNPVPQT